VLRVHRGVHGAIHLTGVRTRYSGPWIYNMYGDVVDEELGRTITFASAAVGPCPRLPPSANNLIEALQMLLHRRLGSPSPPPISPRRSALELFVIIGLRRRGFSRIGSLPVTSLK
jgi:hypothetical protein